MLVKRECDVAGEDHCDHLSPGSEFRGREGGVDRGVAGGEEGLGIIRSLMIPVLHSGEEAEAGFLFPIACRAAGQELVEGVETLLVLLVSLRETFRQFAGDLDPLRFVGHCCS